VWRCRDLGCHEDGIANIQGRSESSGFMAEVLSGREQASSAAQGPKLAVRLNKP
jgi:hypothetical protein